MDETIRKEIARLKETYGRLKTEAPSLEKLTNKKIEHHFPVNFWELADSELDQEINDRLNDWRNPQNTDAIRETMREFGRVAELLSWEARKMDSEKLGRVREALSRAYADIEDTLKG